jgi:hypothetical protein
MVLTSARWSFPAAAHQLGEGVEFLAVQAERARGPQQPLVQLPRPAYFTDRTGRRSTCVALPAAKCLF